MDFDPLPSPLAIVALKYNPKVLVMNRDEPVLQPETKNIEVKIEEKRLPELVIKKAEV